MVILVVLAGAVAAGGAVWLWGGIAGAVFGGGWPRMSPDALLGVLVRLPGHVSTRRRRGRAAAAQRCRARSGSTPRWRSLVVARSPP